MMLFENLQLLQYVNLAANMDFYDTTRENNCRSRWRRRVSIKRSNIFQEPLQYNCTSLGTGVTKRLISETLDMIPAGVLSSLEARVDNFWNIPRLTDCL